MEPVWILGAGGHARVLVDAIQAERRYKVVGALDDDEAKHGTTIAGVPVRAAISREAINLFQARLAIIAIGDNQVRAAVNGRLHGLLAWIKVIHPRAHIASDVMIGDGTVLLAGAVVQTGAQIGRHVIINTCSSVDHGSRIGDYSHVAPGAHLGGTVIVHEGAVIGIGATVINGRTVGRWGTLGAGAVAVTDIPDNAMAFGVPARCVREKKQAENPALD
jgi:sugar O-acyltransferase (sialic acid O-acetyltransferase NeuD family)